MKIIVILLLLFQCPTDGPDREIFDFSRQLKSGEAQIIYLFHAGWIVRTKNHLMIFDYTLPRLPPGATSKPEPWHIRPEELIGHRVTVFVSHSHGDHFNTDIFDWHERVPGIRYIIGWPLESQPGQVTSLPFKRNSLESAGIKIKTVVHNWDGIPESAYLISVDGLEFYFAGDHSTPNDRPAYRENLAYLSSLNRKIDFAFTPTWGGEDLMIEALKPAYTFPMHSARWSDYQEFKHSCEVNQWPTTAIVPDKNGDSFYYIQGGIVR